MGPMPRRDDLAEWSHRCADRGELFREWKNLEEQLAEYAMKVIYHWIKNGTIFHRVQQISRYKVGGSRETLRESDTALELAGCIVAVALKSFRKNLEAGTLSWRPDGGASLPTYFVGQCLLCFPNEYRRFMREFQSANESSLSSISDDAFGADKGVTPDKAATNYLEARRILSGLPKRTQRMLVYASVGYSQKEIATYLGTTSKAVEMVLRRYRNSILKNDSTSYP